MVTLMHNGDEIDILELQLELESLGFKPDTLDTDNARSDDSEPIGTLKNGVVLLRKICGETFEESRQLLSQRGHCGCQTHLRRARAQAKGVVARLTKNAVRPAYDPEHVPFEKSQNPDEKAKWADYLQKTMKPGGLAIYADMPQSHREVLASLLAHDYGKIIEAIEYSTKDLFIELLDLCQAQTVEFPTRGEIRRRIAYIGLWQRFKEGQTPAEIAYELCDDTPNIVSKLRLLQEELRDFHRRDTYGLNDWWGEGVLNMEINGDTRFQSVVL